MAEGGFIGGRGIAGPGDELLWNDEQVDGRLRLDVVDDDAAIVLVLDPCAGISRSMMLWKMVFIRGLVFTGGRRGRGGSFVGFLENHP
jgi:hypothetical protein